MFRLVFASLAALAATAATAQDRRPEPLGDFETVYQRVLTRPGAERVSEPGASDGEALPPFTPFYVYGRQDGFVEVGPSASVPPEGWIAADKTVDWAQNIVAAFTNSAGRSRQLIFDSKTDLVRLMEHEDIFGMQDRYLEETETGTLEADSGVVSVEPAEFIDISDQFYILPILGFSEELHPITYEENLLLEIASIPLDDPDEATREAEDFEVGVVFVIDTTMSMEPYIQATRAALTNTIEALRQSDIGDSVHFGAIAFRDNPASGGGELEYRTKIVAPLARRTDAAEVAAAIGGTEEARSSTRAYNEDSLAGVVAAIKEMDWEQGGDPFGGKYIILVTDAGPKPAQDPDSGTELDTQEVQGLAEENNIGILTLHLKSPSGTANHGYAESAYRSLSQFAGQTFYYPVEGASESAFELETERLTRQLVDHVNAARGAASIAPEEDTDEAVRILGNAMLLAYLGGGGGTEVPDLIEGWVSVRAVAEPAEIAFEPRLLLTKNELATLADLVRDFVRLGEAIESNDDAEAFFDELREAILRMSQNPDRVLNAEAERPGDALEFLAGLPFKSDILDLDYNRWIESATERRRIVDGLKPKQRLYRVLLEDDDTWTALYDGASDGEKVYAMPLRFLP